jgi:hypothetical protein
MEGIYAAWHGAGVDIAGGNWSRFVGMLPLPPQVKEGLLQQENEKLKADVAMLRKALANSCPPGCSHEECAAKDDAAYFRAFDSKTASSDDSIPESDIDQAQRIR